MFTQEVAKELGLDVGRVGSMAQSLDVEMRCGRRWWSPEKIEQLEQELARRAEALRIKSLLPRTAEVASRLGIGKDELRALIREHHLPVERDKAGGAYLWTDQAIAAVEAFLAELAPAEPPAPPPSGLTSKQVAARLKMRHASFSQFSLAARERHPALQPTLHEGTLYWSQEDLALLQQELGEQRARPDLQLKRLVQAQKRRLAKLQEHARASRPQATAAQQQVESILALCAEIEASLALPLAFFNTLPFKGWTLRRPVAVWVNAVLGGYEAQAMGFDLWTRGRTSRGAIESLRHALFERYQELARDPTQDQAAWIALRQLVVPPE